MIIDKNQNQNTPANDVCVSLYRSIGDSISSFLKENNKFNNIFVSIGDCDLSGYPKPKNVTYINQKKINADFLKM